MTMRRRLLVPFAIFFSCDGPATDRASPAVASVAVDGGGGSLGSLGETRQLSARPLDAQGRAASAPVFWVSTNTGAVAIDQGGLATATGAGTAELVAFAGGAVGRATLAVRQLAAQLVMTPSSANVEAGATTAFALAATDAAGHPAEVRGAAWATGDRSIATVDQDGTVSGVAPGSTSVTAVVDGRTALAQIIVAAPAVASIRVDAGGAEATLTSLGASLQLSATALDARGNAIAGPAFAWASDHPGVAQVGSTGAVLALANGTATISARAGGKTGQLAITVRQEVAVVTVFPPAVTLLPGQAQVFTAAATDALGNSVTDAPAASWSTGDGSIATIDQAGRAVAQPRSAASPVLVQAQIAGVAGLALLTVDPNAPDVALIAVSGGGKAPDLTALGATLQLAAHATDSSNHPLTGVAFAWDSKNPAVATVDQSGLVTAVSNGSAVIRATAGGVTGETPVGVEQAAATVAVMTHAPGASTTLASIGDTLQLDGVPLDANGHLVAGVAVGWLSSNAGAASVDPKGLVTAVGNGTARITGSTASGKSGFVDVTVQQAVASVVVSAAQVPATLASLGDTLQLSALGQDARGHTVTSATTYSWRSESPGVASVDVAGIVTAVANGQAVIHAKAGNGVDGSLAVKVAQVAAAVLVSGSPATLTSVGDAVTLAAVAKDAGGSALATPPGFTWMADDGAVVAVAPSGDTLSAAVTALKNGATFVHAATAGIDGKLQVTVQQAVARIAVAPSPAQLASFGAQLTLTATAQDARSNSIPGAHTYAWSSDDTSIIKVAAAGDTMSATVTAQQKNAATKAHAKLGAVDGFATVTVQQAAASVAVSAAGNSTTLSSINQTLQLSAAARDANGNAIVGAPISFSGNTAVASVSAAGLVTALANGTATVTATSGAAQGTLDVTVQQAVATVSVSPATAVVAAGKTEQLSSVAKDAGGTPVAAAAFSWASADTTHAPVDINGSVSATLSAGEFGAGPIAVNATSSGKSGSAQLNVAVYKPWTFASAGGPGLNVDVKNNQYVIFNNTDSSVTHSIVLDNNPTSNFVAPFTGASDSIAKQVVLGAGSYSFHCGIHGTSMKGTLVVH